MRLGHYNRAAMKIGIDARLTYYRTGGISTTIRRLVRELEKLDEHNAYTVFHRRGAQETVPMRFNRADLWTPSHHRLERTALSVELSRFSLDVFHSTDFIPPRRGAKRHVTTIYDLTFLHYPQFLTAQSRRYYNNQIHAAARHADHILTISEASCADIINMLGVQPDKVSVHLLAADESFSPQSPHLVQAMRTELKLPTDYILFVGTFEPRKNILGLLKAYQRLQHTLPDAPALVLAGNRGWLFEETMQQINTMKLDKHVLWRENVPQKWLPALYSGAILHVLPSFYEGFGLPALEAMACGTVPIVSNTSSLPEVVGNVGKMVDPHDHEALAAAIEHAITDDTWRTTQAQAAQQRAKTFHWSHTAQTALNAYQKVMA